MGYGGAGVNGVAVRKREGERERGDIEREEEEVMSPWPSTRPDTRSYWGQ